MKGQIQKQLSATGLLPMLKAGGNNLNKEASKDNLRSHLLDSWCSSKHIAGLDIVDIFTA